MKSVPKSPSIPFVEQVEQELLAISILLNRPVEDFQDKLIEQVLTISSSNLQISCLDVLRWVRETVSAYGKLPGEIGMAGPIPLVINHSQLPDQIKSKWEFDLNKVLGKTQWSPAVLDRGMFQSKSGVEKLHPIMNHSRKVGRNQLCPCGSGKKFKLCHGDGQRWV